MNTMVAEYLAGSILIEEISVSAHATNQSIQDSSDFIYFNFLKINKKKGKNKPVHHSLNQQLASTSISCRSNYDNSRLRN